MILRFFREIPNGAGSGSADLRGRARRRRGRHRRQPRWRRFRRVARDRLRTDDRAGVRRRPPRRRDPLRSHPRRRRSRQRARFRSRRRRGSELNPPITSSGLARQRGLYVHFPYCAKKCPYCDFNSHAVEHDDRRYADAVLAEMEERAFPGSDRSRASSSAAARRAAGRRSKSAESSRAARDRYGFAENIEITLEANPGTVAEARMFAFVAAGVNRFSIGVQSFDDRRADLARPHPRRLARRDRSADREKDRRSRVARSDLRAPRPELERRPPHARARALAGDPACLRLHADDRAGHRAGQKDRARPVHPDARRLSKRS